jgi:hypothetical protein
MKEVINMTREEAHRILSNGLVNAPSEHEWCVAFKKAIDTMHKYQKIQEIVRWNDAPSPYYKPDGQLFREICEVLKDE